MLSIKNNIGGGKSEGLNVWARHYYTPEETVTGLRFTATQPATSDTLILLKISNQNFDISRISNWVDFYAGFIDNSGNKITKYDDTKVMWKNMVSDLVNSEMIRFTTKAYGSEIIYTFTYSGTKTLNAVVGEIKDYVIDDDPSAYPNGAVHTDGYYYELYGHTFNIVTWASGTDEEIVAMVELADKGLINLSDYWAVGDTRTVQLSAMDATGVGESHAAQTVDLVLMHVGGYELNEAVASGRTTCSFIVGQKDSLATAGYMNSSNTNSGSWNGSARRTWCNSVYKNALPSTLLPIFKQFKTITAQTYNGSTNQESVDYFALPAAKEVFGGSATSAGSATSYSNLNEFNALFQFDYYATTSNRVKKIGKTGNAGIWWERSPCYNDSTGFCTVKSSGNAYDDSASYARGLAPFGCI